MNCDYCGDPVPVERVEIGKTHCTKRSCVAEWRRRRVEASDLVLVLVPKQGMTWVKRDEATTNNRSSGR